MYFIILVICYIKPWLWLLTQTGLIDVGSSSVVSSLVTIRRMRLKKMLFLRIVVRNLTRKAVGKEWIQFRDVRCAICNFGHELHSLWTLPSVCSWGNVIWCCLLSSQCLIISWRLWCFSLLLRLMLHSIAGSLSWKHNNYVCAIHTHICNTSLI